MLRQIVVLALVAAASAFAPTGACPLSARIFGRSSVYATAASSVLEVDRVPEYDEADGCWR